MTNFLYFLYISIWFVLGSYLLCAAYVESFSWKIVTGQLRGLTRVWIGIATLIFGMSVYPLMLVLEDILPLVFLPPIFALFFYIGLYDLLRKEIPMIPTYILIVLSVVLIVLLEFFGSATTEISNGYGVKILLHVAAGFGYGVFFLLISVLTKGRGMGDGDAYIAAPIGFLLGLAKTATSFYIAIGMALLVSVIIWLKKKTIKNVAIPLVPFLLFGFIVAFYLPFDIFVFFGL